MTIRHNISRHLVSHHARSRERTLASHTQTCGLCAALSCGTLWSPWEHNQSGAAGQNLQTAHVTQPSESAHMSPPATALAVMLTGRVSDHLVERDFRTTTGGSSRSAVAVLEPAAALGVMEQPDSERPLGAGRSLHSLVTLTCFMLSKRPRVVACTE